MFDLVSITPTKQLQSCGLFMGSVHNLLKFHCLNEKHSHKLNACTGAPYLTGLFTVPPVNRGIPQSGPILK